MWLLELASVYWQQGNTIVKELNASKQAVNAPLQYPCLCTFKLLSLDYTCTNCLLGSTARNLKILIANNWPTW